MLKYITQTFQDIWEVSTYDTPKSGKARGYLIKELNCIHLIMTITLLARLHQGDTKTRLWNYTDDEIVENLESLWPQDIHPTLRIICVKHRGKKKETPHYHIVFQYIGDQWNEITVPLAGFTTKFKSLFSKGSGNAHHSIKLGDGNDKCYSYLFHENAGSDCVIYHKGHTEQEIEDFVKLNEDIQSEWETPSQLCKAIAHELSLTKPIVKQSHQSIARLVWAKYTQRDKTTFFPNKAQMDRYVYRIYAIINSQEESFNFYYTNNFGKK